MNDGEGQALALRKGAAFYFPVARGPIPRDENRPWPVARGPVPRDRYRKGRRFFPIARGPSDAIRASERVSPTIAAWRGTGPRPTVKGDVFCS